MPMDRTIMDHNVLNLDEDGRWRARWVPNDASGGGQLLLECGGHEVDRHRYLFDPPNDDTLRRWASEQLVRVAQSWRAPCS